eukprot:m.145749 g.145749  ORF g.145749 m.145749 type:complete len:558 (+) comp38432_c1_seq9:36-1709(+)
MASGNLYAIFNNSSPEKLERVSLSSRFGEDKIKSGVKFPKSPEFPAIDHILIYEKLHSNAADNHFTENLYQQSWKVDLKLDKYKRTLKDLVPIGKTGRAIAVPLHDWLPEEKSKVANGTAAELILTIFKESPVQMVEQVVHVEADGASNRYSNRSDDDQSSTHSDGSDMSNSLLENGKRAYEPTGRESSAKRAKTTSVPTKRFGHGMCAISDDTAVMVGGETTSDDDHRVHNDDSFYQLKLIQSRGYCDVKWTKVEVKSKKDEKKQERVGHQVVCSGQSSIHLLGGFKYYSVTKQKSNDKKGLLNDNGDWVKAKRVPTFLIESSERVASSWNSFPSKGNIQKMSYHAAVMYQRHIITFGGTMPVGRTGPDDYLGEFYRYSIDSFKWEKLEMKPERPSKRAFHSMVLIGAKIYMFGGMGDAEMKNEKSDSQSSDKVFNDLYIVDLEAKTVDQPSCPIGETEWPSKRYNHIACLLPDCTMLIHGGEGEDGNILGDAYKLKTNSLHWRKVTHPKLIPLCGHSVVVLGNHVVLFGGGTPDQRFTNETIVFDYHELEELESV